MRRAIILEGPDGSGKTVLAKKLERLGAHYHHEGPPQRNDMLLEYAKTFIHKVGIFDDLVLDRAHVGEAVYGPVLRGRDRVGGLPGLLMLNRLYGAYGAKVVFCLPPKSICTANWKARRIANNELVTSAARFSKIYDMYRAYSEMMCSHCPEMISWYDYTELPDVPPWMFNPQPNIKEARYVFFGANQNGLLPFFGSEYFHFMSALYQAGFKEWEMAFINTMDVKEARALLTRHDTPRLKYIIAVGEVAAGILRSMIEFHSYGLAFPAVRNMKRMPVTEFKRIHDGKPAISRERFLR